MTDSDSSAARPKKNNNDTSAENAPARQQEVFQATQEAVQKLQVIEDVKEAAPGMQEAVQSVPEAVQADSGAEPVPGSVQADSGAETQEAGASETSGPEGESAVSASPRKSVGKVFGIVAILTVLSKFAGLARDIVVSRAFGQGVITDAYQFAYLLTGNILILFGGLGGPFHSSVVAIVTPKKDDPEVGKLVGQILAITVLILLVASVVIFLFAPFFLHLIAPGRADLPEVRDAAVTQLRLMIPLIVISGIVGVSYGILNVYERFFWPSFSPAIASLAIIVAVLFFRDQAGICLAIGTLAGAVGQMVVQLPGVAKSPLKISVPLKAQPGLTQYGSMLWPAFIGTSIGQLNTFIDSNFASSLEPGSFTALVNANRLIQLPLGVLLTAMLVPMLPRFTEHVVSNRTEELKVELRRSLRFLWFLALPIGAIMLAIPGPLVKVLFQRGQFTEQDTAVVAGVLLFLVPSIFFYVARDLITRVFYAHQDSKTPYYIAMAAIVVHYLLDWALVIHFKVNGIALALTLATIFNLTCLSFFLRKKIGHIGATRLVQPLAVMFAASAVCGAVAFYSHQFAAQFLPTGLIGQLIALTVSGGLSLTSYALVCILFKLDEPTMLLKRVMSKAGRAASQS